MNKVQPLTRSFIIVTALATVLSTFTLWLIDSWIKYPLFLFEILTVLVLFTILSGYDVKLRATYLENVHIGLKIDLFFITSALALLIINALHTQGGLIQLVLVLLCTSILSGHALLNILGLIRQFSKLEIIVLSYLLSYMFTGFMALISLVIEESLRATLMLCAFIVLGLISALKHKDPAFPIQSRSFSKNTDYLVISIALAFYALVFFFMYPGFASLPGTDISRHYASSIVLSRTPNLYISSGYLLAHLHESMILLLSGTSLINVQMALLTLNFILPLAFFTMAKHYLDRIDARLPSLATLFWVLFTNSYGGFTWLYFTNLKLSATGQTQLQLLTTTADKTYNGTIYGLIGLWYVPATVSIVILMTAASLMRKKEVPTSKFVPLFSTMMVAMYLTHVTEAVIFAMFLAIYGVLSKNDNLRIDDSIKSSIIGLLFVVIVYYIFSLFAPRFILGSSLLFALILPILTLLLSALFRKFLRQRLNLSQIRTRITSKSLLKTLVLSILFLYTFSFLYWASATPSIHTGQFDAIGLVPWFLYSLMLGMNGLLAILALYYLIGKPKFSKVLTLFIAFMIFAFIIGKLVSIANIYFFNAGYWEKRFMWLIKIPLAILAPIPVILSIDILKRKIIDFNLKTVTLAAIIGTIVLSGISTTFLNLEYWSIVTNNPSNQPSSAEMEAINTLKKIFENDPKTWLTTVTSTSTGMATLAAPADKLGLKQLLYTAYRPEMAFTQFYRHPAYTHPYIYVHNRDADKVNEYADRFLAKYLKMLPVIFNNSEVKIYNVSKPSLPQPISDNALLLPLDKFLDEENLRIAYEILSQGFFNYTVSYDLDNKALNVRTIILPFDPVEVDVRTGVFQDGYNHTLESWSISKGTWFVEDGELVGGQSGEYGEGIILSPVYAENFTASFTANPKDGDSSELNYVDLVYSWVDPRNYRIAELLFHSDSHVYILLRTFINGVERTFPDWPGIKTDLKWDFGNEFDVKVTVNDGLNEISINGKTYLSSDLQRISGRIGLRYYRFYTMSISNFSIAYTARFNLRPVNSYLEYLHQGGRIILLNTNGYAFFADDLFSVSNLTLNAQRIEGQNLNSSLPREIPVSILSYKNSSTSAVANYVATLYETPFISHQSYGNGELFYVNVYPIVRAMREGNQSVFYELLGKLLENLNLTKLNPDAQISLDAYVREIYLGDGVTIETDSLLFPQQYQLEQIDVEADNLSYTFYNVTAISIHESPRFIIEADSASTQNGDGFYTRIQINSTFSVEPIEGSLTLKMKAGDDGLDINNVRRLSIQAGIPSQLLVRTPTIKASEATFIEFYPQGNLQSQTRTYGQNLKTAGPTDLSIVLSDTYSIIDHIKLGESFERDPPIVTFDISSALLLFWSLLLLPVFACVFLVLKARQSRRITKLKNRKLRE